MVQISPNAAKEIKRIKLNRQKPDSFLRIAVKSGGCSGLLYNLELAEITTTQESDDGTTSTGDRLLKLNDISVVVDPISFKYIENLQLDYSEDLMGGGFRFHNPKAKNVCGCGMSFAEVEEV